MDAVVVRDSEAVAVRETLAEGEGPAVAEAVLLEVALAEAETVALLLGDEDALGETEGDCDG